MNDARTQLFEILSVFPMWRQAKQGKISKPYKVYRLKRGGM